MIDKSKRLVALRKDNVILPQFVIDRLVKEEMIDEFGQVFKLMSKTEPEPEIRFTKEEILHTDFPF